MDASHAQSIASYNNALSAEEQRICALLRKSIEAHLPKATGKLWHGSPAWFLDGNPVVGYSKQKPGLRLMFWSGADFGEAALRPGTGKFKDASIFYTSADQVNGSDLKRWLGKAERIQWDYKNIVKRKGKLVRLESPGNPA